MSRITIRSHNKVWQIENRVYAVGNWKLPMPISPKAIFFFGAAALLMRGLSMAFDAVAALPPMLRYGIIPYAAAQFFLKIKLDGKAPHKYFIAWLKWLASHGEYIERFNSYPGGRTDRYKLEWQISRGNWR